MTTNTTREPTVADHHEDAPATSRDRAAVVGCLAWEDLRNAARHIAAAGNTTDAKKLADDTGLSLHKATAILIALDEAHVLAPGTGPSRRTQVTNPQQAADMATSWFLRSFADFREHVHHLP